MASPSVRRSPRLDKGAVATGLLAVLCLAGIVTLFTQGRPAGAPSAGPAYTALDPDTRSHGSLADMIPAALEGAALQLEKQGKPAEKPRTVLRLR